MEKSRKKDFTDQAHEAISMLIGEAAVQLVAERRAVTNESLAAAIVELSAGGPDLAEDFAL